MSRVTKIEQISIAPILLQKTSIKILRGDTSKEKTLLFSIKDEEKKQKIISELTK